MIGQPDAIFGDKENETRAMHVAGSNCQQHRIASSGSDCGCRFLVCMQVDVMSVHFLEAGLQNRSHELPRCSMQ